MLKISIITAVLNRAYCISNAINSVNSQDYHNIEHIFVDGGSTDGTCDLIYTNMRHGSIVLTEPDLGLYDALNKGIKLATGDIIGVLHSDDWYANNQVLSKIAKEFASGDYDIVYGDAVFYSSKDGKRPIRRYHSGEFSLDRMEWGWIPAHTSMYIKRQIYDELGGYMTHYKIAGDYEFFCRLFVSSNQTKYSYIRDVLVNMTIGGISTKGIRNTIFLNREVLQACKENGIKSNYLKILSKYPWKLLELIFK